MKETYEEFLDCQTLTAGGFKYDKDLKRWIKVSTGGDGHPRITMWYKWSGKIWYKVKIKIFDQSAPSTVINCAGKRPWETIGVRISRLYEFYNHVYTMRDLSGLPYASLIVIRINPKQYIP